MMQISKMKFKYAIQVCVLAYFFISNYCLVTRTLKLNLELIIRLPLEKKNTLKNQNVSFLNMKKKLKYFKSWILIAKMKYKHAF